MAGKSFTMFELHFHRGFSIGPGSPELEEAEEEAEVPEIEAPETEAPDVSIEESESAGPSRGDAAKLGIAALLVLGLLAAIAIAVKKLGGEPPEGLEEVDELAEQL